MTSGISIILVGCLYAGFWLIALHEWNYAAQIPQSRLTKIQFEEKCPVLKIIFRWWDFAPFENRYEDRCIAPAFFIHRNIVYHAIIGGSSVFIGIILLTIAIVRKNKRSEQSLGGDAETSAPQD